MMSSEELFINFVNRARDIVQQDMMFKIRRRMNGHHPAADVDYETELHNTHQHNAWQIVKSIYGENREYINEHMKDLPTKDKETVQALAKVIDEELDQILLGEE